MGANLAKNPLGKPERWIVDFSNRTLEDSSEYKLPFKHVETYVKPERETNREAVMREKWWRFKRTNESMRTALDSVAFYFTVPRVSKWAIFIPVPLNWLPGDKSVVIVSEDFYVLGILASSVHRTWMDAQKSTLEDRTAYTPTTCFETFPFPQSANSKLTDQIRSTTQALHHYRTEQMEKKQWGITDLYNKFFNEPASQLRQLHDKLDRLVLQAYGFSPEDDLLAKLLELNLLLSDREKQGLPVVGPHTPIV